MNIDKCLDFISPSKSTLFVQQNQAEEIYLIKENVGESQVFVKMNSMPLPQSNDVLMTVTNSLNNNNNNGSNSFCFKKSTIFTANPAISGNNNVSLASQTLSQTSTNTSGKKDNDKKLWMKRI